MELERFPHLPGRRLSLSPFLSGPGRKHPTTVCLLLPTSPIVHRSGVVGMMDEAQGGDNFRSEWRRHEKKGRRIMV